MKITHVPTPMPKAEPMPVTITLRGVSRKYLLHDICKNDAEQPTPKDWLEAAVETAGFLLVCAAFFFVMTAVYVYGGGG